MQRMKLWAAILGVGAAIAVDNLISERLANASWWVLVVALGLFFGALVVFGTAIVSAWRDRSRATAGGLRWAGLVAVSFSVLVFANCSGPATSGNHGAMSDAAGFWGLASFVSLPLLIALGLPAVLATIGWRTAAVVSTAAILVVVLVTMAIAFYAGISACYFGTSPGACAAGFAGLGNVFSLASIALFVPYLQMLASSQRYRPQAASRPADAAPRAPGA